MNGPVIDLPNFVKSGFANETSKELTTGLRDPKIKDTPKGKNKKKRK